MNYHNEISEIRLLAVIVFIGFCAQLIAAQYFSGLTVLFIGVLLVASIYSVTHYFSSSDRSQAESTSDLPTENSDSSLNTVGWDKNVKLEAYDGSNRRESSDRRASSSNMRNSGRRNSDLESRNTQQSNPKGASNYNG